MKPVGKYLKSHDDGYEARMSGKPISENPNEYNPDIAMSSWWDSGWQKAERTLKEFEVG